MYIQNYLVKKYWNDIISLIVVLFLLLGVFHYYFFNKKKIFRTACIEYFRGGYGRPFDNSFGSFNSRSTADSWLTNSLSRVSSISHPDLFNSEIYNDIQNGASNKRVIEVLTNDGKK